MKVDYKLAAFIDGCRARAKNESMQTNPHKDINSDEHCWLNNGWIKYHEFLRDCK